MKTTEIKHKFIELRAKGLSFAKISKKIKISRQTLIDWNKDFENEIANLKAMELEELNYKYYLHRVARIESFGIILNRLKSELKERELTALGTDKLLELFLKYDIKLNEVIIEPNYRTSDEINENKATIELLENLTTSTDKLLKVG